jgi:prepilin peptidase CpaA
MYVQITVWLVEFLALACLFAAAASDIERRIIPNQLVLAVMVLGVVVQSLVSPRHIWVSLAIWVCAMAGLGLMAAKAIVGWGDVKLMAAVTTLVPPSDVLQLFLAVLIMGGLLSVVYLGIGQLSSRPAPPEGGAPQRFAASVRNELSEIGARRSLPYAVAILCGVAYHIARTTMRCWPATSC